MKHNNYAAGLGAVAPDHLLTCCFIRQDNDGVSRYLFMSVNAGLRCVAAFGGLSKHEQFKHLKAGSE
eukprot:scaffold189624_cov28-Prasinocladus_malaysianus.AAC.1